MFTSVRIQNFRQFRDLKLEGLGQINLITGANDTGKTSLLEAISLLLSPTDPEIVRTIADIRGIDTIGVEGRDAWGWIFHDAAESQMVTIESTDSIANRAELTVRTSQGLQFPAVFPQKSTTSSASREPVISTAGRPLHSLEFAYSDRMGNTRLSRLRLDDAVARTEREGDPIRNAWFFLGTRPVSSTSMSQMFSRLVQAGREDDVVDALRVVDPRVRRLLVLDTGFGPSIHADMGTGAFFPMSVLGQGASRMLTMVTSLLESDGGVVLIDEVDDGLHYSVLVDVWRVIIETALKHSVQVFATTHSWECIEAAVKSSEAHDGKLALFRLQRDKNDIRAVDIGDEDLRSAVGLGVELR
jgi:predicted ATPase